MAPRIKLGELLVRAGVLDEYKLKAALAEQARWGGRIGKILVDMNFVSEEILVKALSKQLAVPLARLDHLEIPPELLAKLDGQFARQHHVCPERLLPDRRTLVLAMSDPINVKVIDEVSYRTGCRIEPTLAGDRAIMVAIAKVFGAETAAIEAGGGEAVFVDARGQTMSTAVPAEPKPAPAPALSPEQGGMVDALDAAQKKQLRAIRAMVELLVDKGIFSRDEYLSRLNRR